MTHTLLDRVSRPVATPGQGTPRFSAYEGQVSTEGGFAHGCALPRPIARSPLDEYTYAKTIEGLESRVKKARADELARRAVWDREKSREGMLERLLDRT